MWTHGREGWMAWYKHSPVQRYVQWTYCVCMHTLNINVGEDVLCTNCIEYCRGDSLMLAPINLFGEDILCYIYTHWSGKEECTVYTCTCTQYLCYLIPLIHYTYSA